MALPQRKITRIIMRPICGQWVNVVRLETVMDDIPPDERILCPTAGCGTDLGAVSSGESCPSCGKRLFRQSLDGTATAYSSIKLAGRRGGRGKPFLSLFSGWDWWRSRARWMFKTQRVDRENNRYTKRIEDPKRAKW